MQIDHIAKLARLALTKEEKEKFGKQFSDIIKFVSQLQEVDVSQVEPTAQVTGLTDVMRQDEVCECDKETRKKLLALMPEKSGDLLKVQGVFE